MSSLVYQNDALLINKCLEATPSNYNVLHRADLLAMVLLAILSLSLYILRLETPPTYVHDEVYHAYTGAQYAQGNPDAYVWYTRAPREGVEYTWNHPPVGRLFIAVGVLLLGDNPLGWRVTSSIFGAVGIALVYLLTLTLTRQRAVAVLSSTLLLVDGLYFVQSRIGMVDIYGTVFMVGAFLAFYRYLTSPPDRARCWLLLTGGLMGLAIATKWNAIYPSVSIGLVVAWRWHRLRSIDRKWYVKPEVRSGLRRHLLWVAAGILGLPFAAYLLSYVSFFLTGHRFSEFVQLQGLILSYHSTLTETHPYQSSWLSWPFALRPVRYYGFYTSGTIANIYANGNPLLFWTFLPAIAWLSRRWWRERNPALVVLLICFFGRWLPWMLVPRSAFLYHFLPAVPFGCLAIAVLLVDLWRRGKVWRALAAGYGVGVVLAFAYFYPIYSALPLTYSGFEARMWLPSWRL